MVATGDGWDFIGTGFLDVSGLESTRQWNMTKIGSASNNLLSESVTMAVRLRMSKLCTSGTFEGPERWAIPILFKTAFIERCVAAVHPVERVTVPYHLMWVPVITVH